MQRDVASLEDLVREITARNLHVVLPRELRRKEHTNGALGIGTPFDVWRCTSFGGSVAEGSISIAPDGIFLLSGKGARFTDTTFNGERRLI